MDAGPNKRWTIAGMALALLVLVVVVRRAGEFHAASAPAEPAASSKLLLAESVAVPLSEPVAAMAEPVAPSPEGVRTETASALCRRLTERIRAWESPETIALSAELVRRGDAAVDALEETLRSGEQSAEIAALRLLVRIGTPRALAAGLVRLCQEPASDAQNELRKVFGNADSRPVAEAVADMAVREERPEERRNLQAVVAALEGGAIVETLAERIRTAEREEDLQPWLELLAGVSRPSNVPALGNLLLDDSRVAVQETVAAALAGIGDGRACRLLADFGAEIPACRAALARVRSPYAETALREIAADDPDAGVRAAASQALAGRE